MLKQPKKPDMSAQTCQMTALDLSGGVTCSPELSGGLTCSEDQTCQVSLHVGPKHVSSPDTPSLHEEKEHEEKKDHAAAAADMSDLPDDDLTDFFDRLATALAAAGYSGIRAAQFADLKGFLADYTNLTGSPPDQRTADYIVRRVSETAGIRNVAAFVRRLARDVLTTGEGFVAYEPPPPAPPPEHPAEPLPPPDWAVLHLSHVEQDSPPQEVWDAVLGVLRGQVSSTAYETWLIVVERICLRGWAVRCRHRPIPLLPRCFEESDAPLD